MNNFEAANLVLTNILLKEIPFSIALKNTFDKNNDISKESRALITGLVGCELRHHLLFRALLKEKYGYAKEEEEKFVPIYLLLTNELYYHRFDFNQIVLNASKLSDKPAKELTAYIEELKAKEKIIPSNIVEGSLEYLSLRFNTPLWLVKMWDKQYGRATTFKTLKGNSKTSKVTCGVNTRNSNKEKLLGSGNFIASKVDNCLIYQGKEVLRSTDYSKHHNVYLEKMPYIDIMNKLECDPFAKVALFSGYANNLLLDYVFLKNPQSKIDVIVPEYRDYLDLKNTVNQFRLQNIQLYDAKANVIESCISEPVDVFFLLARNTNFENFNRLPDYFLQCKNQKLDPLINEQRYSLEEAYNCLNVGGQLLYMVPTLNKKETSVLIKDFLLIHRDMSLVEEKHYLPFEEGESLMYYVKMIKTEHKYD